MRHILILGAGAGGTIAVNMLHKQLSETQWRITCRPAGAYGFDRGKTSGSFGPGWGFIRSQVQGRHGRGIGVDPRVG